MHSSSVPEHPTERPQPHRSNYGRMIACETWRSSWGLVREHALVPAVTLVLTFLIAVFVTEQEFAASGESLLVGLLAVMALAVLFVLANGVATPARIYRVLEGERDELAHALQKRSAATPKLSFGRAEVPRTWQHIRLQTSLGHWVDAGRGRVIRVPVTNAQGATTAERVHARVRFIAGNRTDHILFAPPPTQGEWVGLEGGPQTEIDIPGNGRPYMLDIVVVMDRDYPQAHEWTTRSRAAGLSGYAIKATPFKVEIQVMGSATAGDAPRIANTLGIEVTRQHRIRADWTDRSADEATNWAPW
jgi:hypothetical protein